VIDMSTKRTVCLCFLATMVLACAGPATDQTSSRREASALAGVASTGPKRIVIAMAGDPPGLSTHINPAGTATPGLPDLVELTSPGVSAVGSDGQLVPILAASLPAVERGSWLVSPDGTMQTTWKLREGVTWHDGQPFTSADPLLAATVGKDPELS
jgi:ABC-type transport system substrate-binding protein